MRAVRYLRVSTLDQRPELQADETAEFIRRRWGEVGETDTYLDHGVSGTKGRRPGLDRLLADAKKRRFDVLVVWRADRLFRSLTQMVATLGELSAFGIDFVSVTEPFDTSTPQGRLLLHLVSAFAEFERGVLVERTRAGMAAARRRGRRIGRPQAQVDLTKARALRAAGRSIRQIAKELSVSVGTIHRVLADAAARVQEGLPRASSQVAGSASTERASDVVREGVAS
jgi:DNA invertase Pin-like site-specific DNA recombinase